MMDAKNTAPKDNIVNLPESEEDKQRYIEELRKKYTPEQLDKIRRMVFERLEIRMLRREWNKLHHKWKDDFNR